MGRLDRHPPGLYVLFFTEMWERFGFYTMGAMFTLYLRSSEGFSWEAAAATTLNSWYLGFVYASPLIGGWIADRGLGYRKSVLIGGVIFMLGYLLFTFHSLAAVYAALACLVIGNGFFKPNVSAMVGQLYPEGSALKDRAYNIFYMGINIGAFFAPIVAEFMKSLFGFRPAFAVAAGGMIISVAILWRFKRYVEMQKGAPAHAPPEEEVAVTEDAPPAAPPPRRPIDNVPDVTRIGALIVIFLIVIVFWMVFHQNSSTMTYWANENTDWKVSGIISNAINPFWVVALSMPMVWFWQALDRRGLEPSTPTKMMYGMVLTCFAFLILYFAAKRGEAVDVRPELYPTGSFRITDLTLANLKEDGVPEEILKKLAEAKDGDQKLIIKDRVFNPDDTFAEALETIKQTLKSEGLEEDDWKLLKDAKVEEGGRFGGERSFTVALEGVIDNLLYRTEYVDLMPPPSKSLPRRVLREQRVSDDVVHRMRQYLDRKFAFTGEEKLRDALTRVIGPEETSQYQNLILRRAYLYKVSPWWLILTYAVLTLGELCLSPMGLSLVSKVAPVRLRGVMMGGWFLATAIGNKLTVIGVLWDYWPHSSFWLLLSGLALVMAGVLFVLLKPLKKAMPGV
jgi:POT family proton-dependent oligopeptide transporter